MNGTPRLSDSDLIKLGLYASLHFPVGPDTMDLEMRKVPKELDIYQAERFFSVLLPDAHINDVVRMQTIQLQRGPTIKIGYSDTLHLLCYTDPIIP